MKVTFWLPALAVVLNMTVSGVAQRRWYRGNVRDIIRQLETDTG